ncbi:hypothetical protein CASFOL_015627 [Castilleja foliolosa]|uniref:pyridoxal 5'-phosphate synthase n=1 Tax=Castilleja foliolosa TaxID=1961234 RepID=A0ABD3DHY8_9LAMI
MASAKIVRDPASISYLNQREAAEIDEILMGPLGFSVDQLMELAGLSVATSIAEVYKPTEHNRVLAICGPGNNGGDGLVAARHLHHFGYRPFICYPKRTAKALYNGLVTQLESLSVPFISVEDLPADLSTSFDIVVDAMFGFSFHGHRVQEKCSPRPPFDDLIQRLVALENPNEKNEKSTAIVSIDIPSGWHVEEGDLSGKGIKPHMLGSSRMVLLKGFDADGFVWYTNYESQKAHQLSENPRAALLFYWDALNRQVRIEGPVQKVSGEESEQYFHSRPRRSQIGAIVSKQSTVIPGRQFLYQRQEELEAKYLDGSTIPKPKYWGGYRLKPEVFEFWQGQPSRLHDRLRYDPQSIDGKKAWKIDRLSP